MVSSHTRTSHTPLHIHTHTQHTSFSLGKEKEELVKGLEVLQSTCQWFNDRIEQVALEEKQLLSKYGYSEEVRILAKPLT